MDGKKRIMTLLSAALLLTGCTMRAGTAAPTAAPSPAVTATPRPTATPLPEQPTPTPDPFRAEELLTNMTLEEKVGQLFIVRPDALDPSQQIGQIEDSASPGVTGMSESIGNMLVRYPVGGVAFFGKNITSPEQLSAFTAALQNASKTPLFIAVDEEGGMVTRLAGAEGFSLPVYESAAAVGARGSDAAWEMGAAIGGYLTAYGFNVDFAPVADVNTNPHNPVIGSRAFSSDASEAALMAGAMARGLASAGIIPVYKHFPGHGDTAQDSHLALAVTEKTKQELLDCELVPYRINDLTGCAVMVGHIAVPAVTGDSTPASLSRAVVTGLLREELGFDGLVITDALSMGGIARYHTSGEAALAALQAGCDLLLMPLDLGEAYRAVLSAAEDGTIPTGRLDESVIRILEYKHAAGLI